MLKHIIFEFTGYSKNISTNIRRSYSTEYSIETLTEYSTDIRKKYEYWANIRILNEWPGNIRRISNAARVVAKFIRWIFAEYFEICSRNVHMSPIRTFAEFPFLESSANIQTWILWILSEYWLRIFTEYILWIFIRNVRRVRARYTQRMLYE